MSVERCEIIDFPLIQDLRGNLTFLEGGKHIPFEIRRVYYLYDVPAGAERGAHAHKELWQVIIAISGSFDILLDDGFHRKQMRLENPYQGLVVCPMIWRDIRNFSSDALCLVLASEVYDESDYIRDFGHFITVTKERSDARDIS